jgi:nicotinamide-nucleotide amidase
VTAPAAGAVALLRSAGLTVAVAESCSGGLLAKLITDVPGASACFLLGAVTYADSAKMRVLAVSPAILSEHGAVSALTATAMAEGVRQLAGSDLALATTGIAGPDGGSTEKPVGTVFIALAAADGCRVVRHTFAGSRDDVRAATAEAALKMLEDRFADQQDYEGIA